MGWEVEELDATETVDEVLEDIEESHAETVRQEQEVSENLSEAVKKIEEAMLWKTLLTTDVIQDGSARPGIVKSVNDKIKNFALLNLNACLGIEQKSQPKTPAQEIKPLFDKEETQALRLLAAKILKRDITKAIISDYSPQIAQVSSNQPVIKPIQTASVAVTHNQTVAPKKPVAKPKPAQAQKRTAKPKPGPGYIPPPATTYIPNTQRATVGGEAVAGFNTGSFVDQLIQGATGGNVLSQSTSSPVDSFDPNEMF